MEIREFTDVGDLSSRLDRLYAASIDWLLAAVFPVLALLGGFSWLSGVFVQSVLSGKPPGAELRPTGDLAILLYGCLLASLALWVVQCWGLAVRGQTLGKRVLGLVVVDTYDRPAGFVRALLLRSWVFGILVGLVQGWTGPVGSLIPLLDVLFIFLGDKRCLHDYVAGTRVRNTSLAHGRVLPVLAAFGVAALGMGVMLAKVGVNLHMTELKQLANRPGVLPDAYRDLRLADRRPRAGLGWGGNAQGRPQGQREPVAEEPGEDLDLRGRERRDAVQRRVRRHSGQVSGEGPARRVSRAHTPSSSRSAKNSRVSSESGSPRMREPVRRVS
ncbi:MAG: RDD family protein [Myxococcales bacterium]